MRWIPFAVLSLALARCGGDEPAWRQLAAKCASPRSGTNDQKGTVDDEKKWLRAWTDDLYLWYREVPAVDPAAYATAIDYFNALKTPAVTASGKPKDQFHFTYDTAQFEQLSGSGVEVGYGITLAALSRSPPRQYIIAYVEPGSPADTGKLARGAQIMKVDGADLVNVSLVDMEKAAAEKKAPITAKSKAKKIPKSASASTSSASSPSSDSSASV